MITIVIFGQTYTVAELVGHYWPVFLIALLVSLLATPLCRRLALRINVIDMPDATVKTHKKPTAYLGGVGILAGILAGLGVGLWILLTGRHHISQDVVFQTGGFHAAKYFSWRMLTGIGVGAVIACAVGVLDDIYDIKPWQKLLGQAVAAGVLVIAGVAPNLCDILAVLGVEDAPSWINHVFGAPIVLMFILGAGNSLNLLDGLDALCAGVTSIITFAFLILAVILATWGHSRVGDPVRMILCLVLAGGVLGFLPYNWHPAKIFMGDAGSMLLGFIAGSLMILFMERVGSWSLASIIVFGLPILDTAVALIRRFINNKPLFVSDRGHIYDQLMDRGLRLQTTVHWCYLLAMVYAIAGWAAALTRFRYAAAFLVVLVGISAAVVWRLGFLQIPEKPKKDA